MTDFDKVKALLDELGVGYDEENRDERNPYERGLVCERGMRKVEGYVGFHTSFVFDKDGKFKEMGAYE